MLWQDIILYIKYKTISTIYRMRARCSTGDGALSWKFSYKKHNISSFPRGELRTIKLMSNGARHSKIGIAHLISRKKKLTKIFRNYKLRQPTQFNDYALARIFIKNSTPPLYLMEYIKEGTRVFCIPRLITREKKNGKMGTLN